VIVGGSVGVGLLVGGAVSVGPDGVINVSDDCFSWVCDSMGRKAVWVGETERS
jgi:hypothetical protein